MVFITVSESKLTQAEKSESYLCEHTYVHLKCLNGSFPGKVEKRREGCNHMSSYLPHPHLFHYEKYLKDRKSRYQQYLNIHAACVRERERGRKPGHLDDLKEEKAVWSLGNETLAD